MKKQLDIFLTALMFLTRIPVPARIHHDSVLMQQSARYFSWIGILVGGISALTFVLAIAFLSPAISVFVSMLCSILVTGAFHEDGFADVCDAFGGGWTREKILLIMKDSRLGTYGVIGLMGMLSAKFLVLYELSSHFTPMAIGVMIIGAHAISRFTAVTLIQQYEYVTELSSKSGPVTSKRLNNSSLIIAAAGGVLPMLFMSPLYLFSLLPVIIVRLQGGKYFHKWIGGYTGDCLGALQQMTEIAFFIGILITWKSTW